MALSLASVLLIHLSIKEVLNATRQSLVIRAEKLEGYILIAVMHLLTDGIQDQLNAARLLLDLEKRYGQLRLEAACHRAIAYSTISYTSIRKILEQELDRQPIEKDTANTKTESYRFARRKVVILSIPRYAFDG